MTPDGTDTPERIGFTGGYGATFTVKNTGSDADTYTLLCLGSANVTCTGMWPNRLNLNPGQSRQVAVTYDVGAPGWGQIRLSACNPNDWCDLGHYDVPVVGVAGAPIVALRNHNGDHLDRSLCLTSGAGEAAAWQCGDLLVAHSMPGYATLNRERSLTLLYNSAQASPRVRMAAAVTEGGDVAPPQSVVAELRVNGILRASATYSGWGSSTTAETRQIVLAFDASADSTGVHPFTLTLRNQYSGAAYDTTLSGTLIVVNRGTSEFGQGWWLAGVEQLVTVQPSPAILWIGGDGSAKVYAPAGTNTWVAPLGAFRDTLRFDPGTGLYTRTLRHGVRVRFDGAGRHVETVNRAGQKTTFTWAGSPARLTSIQVPPAGVSGTVYTLAYAGGYLDRITDPAGRELDATVTSQRLAALLDPDGYGPGFGYDSGGRMIERTTRRGFQTRFVYGHDLRVTQVRVPLDTASGDTAVTAFQAWDEKALHIGMGGSGLTAIDTALTYTRILGPRVGVADSATFWIDRWGAPTKIVDHSIGATTTIGRSDSTVPALVTDVRYPTDQGSANGRIVKMAWDARANLIEMRDSTSHLGQAGMPTAVTRWTYEDPNTPDSPDSAIDPEDVITRFAYNSMGLTREITAPNGHVTEFEYHTAGSLKGHLRAVVEKDVRVFASASNPDSVADLRTSFAQNALGNDTSMTSPMGHTTRYVRDSVQRVKDLHDPLNHRTEYEYDPLNRLTDMREYEGSPYLETRYSFDIDVLDTIMDPRDVVRAFEYDAAGRQTAEIDDYGNRETRYFDRAGLVDSVRTRVGTLIRHSYDAAGRKTKTAWPARDSASADSVLFTYDKLGRMLTARTSARGIWRTYFANGLLRTDVQARADSGGHHTNTYGYGSCRAPPVAPDRRQRLAKRQRLLPLRGRRAQRDRRALANRGS